MQRPTSGRSPDRYARLETLMPSLNEIRSQFLGKRKIPFRATDHKIRHGRDIT
jgi:hypothetical protein